MIQNYFIIAAIVFAIYETVNLVEFLGQNEFNFADWPHLLTLWFAIIWPVTLPLTVINFMGFRVEVVTEDYEDMDGQDDESQE